MNTPNLILKVNEATPTCKRFQFETLTRPKLTKKNRTTHEPTTFVVEVRSKFTACLGVDYEKEVNDVLESQGHARDFEAQKPAGKHYVNGTNWLMESDTTPGKFYVALSKFEGRETKYFVDGVEATPEQIADLKVNYLPKTGAPSLVEWRTYSVESITSVEPVGA